MVLHPAARRPDGLGLLRPEEELFPGFGPRNASAPCLPWRAVAANPKAKFSVVNQLQLTFEYDADDNESTPGLPLDYYYDARRWYRPSGSEWNKGHISTRGAECAFPALSVLPFDKDGRYPTPAGDFLRITTGTCSAAHIASRSHLAVREWCSVPTFVRSTGAPATGHVVLTSVSSLSSIADVILVGRVAFATSL